MEVTVLLLALVGASLAHISWDKDRMHMKSTTKGSPANKKEENAWYWEKIAKKTLLKHRERRYIEGVAKNAILFMGDGMSVPTVTAARIYQGQREGRTGEETSLYMDHFPFLGHSKTYCVNVQTADSACSATAYLGGVKNNDATIGVTAAVQRGDCGASNLKKNRVYSIMKWAQKAGKSTGVVTTTRITHASPAGAYAHIADRDWESDKDVVAANKDPNKCDDIAEQLVRGETGKHLNVIMGGGRKELLPATVTDPEGLSGVRLDGVNLIKEWVKQKTKKGYSNQYVWNKEQLDSVDSKETDFLLGLFDSDHMDYHLLSNNSHNPTLAEMTRKAIKILRKNPKGYVLFVEGGRIDHAHHDTKSQLSLDEAVEMDKAIKEASKLTKEKDTLTVVTADHAHTFSISGYPVRGNDIFGKAGNSDVDDKPYTSLSYANGPGYKHPTNTGERYDVSGDNTNALDYTFMATAPLTSETHGADDVAVYSKGPWAHLFTGTYEQNFIMHAMCYALRIGPAAHWTHSH